MPINIWRDLDNFAEKNFYLEAQIQNFKAFFLTCQAEKESQKCFGAYFYVIS